MKYVKKRKSKMRFKTVFLASIIFLLVAVIFIAYLVPVISADGILDWLTGKATKPANVTITVSQIQIPWVSTIINPQNVTESDTTNVTFYFNASIPGGANTSINQSTATGNFSLAGQTTRTNTSCINVSNGADWINFSCTVLVYYWDGVGTWTVGAYIKDNSGNGNSNTSITMNLSTSTCFVVSPGNLTWATVIPGATNQQSNNDPTLMNNTCNKNITSGGVAVNATDLAGDTTPTYAILAADFRSGIVDGTTCASGNALVNRSAVAITNAVLPPGNNSINTFNETSGQEQLYYCVPLVNASLTAQTYSTSRLGQWNIQAV